MSTKENFLNQNNRNTTNYVHKDVQNEQDKPKKPSCNHYSNSSEKDLGKKDHIFKENFVENDEEKSSNNFIQKNSNLIFQNDADQQNVTEDIFDLNSSSDYSNILSKQDTEKEIQQSSGNKIGKSLNDQNCPPENSTLSEIEPFRPLNDSSYIESGINNLTNNNVSSQIQALHQTLKQTKEVNNSLVDALHSIKGMIAKAKSKSNNKQNDKTLSPIRPRDVIKSPQTFNKSQMNNDNFKLNHPDSQSDIDKIFYTNEDNSFSFFDGNDQQNEQIVKSLIFENNKMNQEKNELETNFKNVELELIDAKNENNKLHMKLKNLEKRYQKSQQDITSLTEKYHELNEINNNQSKTIEANTSEMEKEKDEIALKCGELLNEMEKLKARNAELEQSFDSFSENNTIYQELKDKNIALVKELNNMKKENAQLKLNLNAKGINNDRLINGLRILKNKYEILQKEKSDIQRNMNQFLQSDQPEVTIKQLQDETIGLKTQLNESLKDKTKIMKELAETQSQNAKLQSKNKQLDEKYAILEEESRDNNKTIDDLRNNVKKLRNANKSLLATIVDVNNSPDKLSSVVQKLNDLQQKNEELSISLESLQNDSGIPSAQYEQLIKEKEKKIQNLTSQLKQEQNDGKKMGQKIVELNSNITQLCDTVSKLRDQQADYDRIKQKNADIVQKNLKLIKDLNQLKETKENSSLLEKLKEENKQNQLKIKQLEKENLELKKQYEALNSEISSDRLNNIEAGGLQHNNEDDVSRLKAHITDLERTAKEKESKLRKDIMQLSNEKESMSKDFNLVQNKNEELINQIKTFESQVEELQNRCLNNQKENELRIEESKQMKSSNFDLIHKLEKNQLEIETLKHEISMLQEKLKTVSFEKQVIEESKSKLLNERKIEMIEKAELVSSLKSCELSKNDLKARFEELEKENSDKQADLQKLTIKYSSAKSGYENQRIDLEKENLQLKDVVVQLKFENNHMMAKIVNFEQERESLDRLKHKLETLEEDNQRLMLENQQARELNEKLTNLSNSLQDKINQSKRIRDIITLKEENAQMKSSIENLNDQVEENSKKYKELNDSNLEMKIKFDGLINENKILKNTSNQYKKEYITQIDDLNQKNAELTFSKEELQQKLDREMTNSQKAIQEFELTKGENLILKDQIERANNEMVNMQKEMKKMRNTYKTKLTLIAKEKEQLEKSVGKLKIDLEKQYQENIDNEKEKKKLQNVIRQMNKDPNNSVSKISHKNSRAASVGYSNNDLNEKIDELTAEIIRIKVENKNLKSQNQELLRINKNYNEIERMFQKAEEEKEELKQTVRELKNKVEEKYNTNSPIKERNIPNQDIYLATKSLQSVFQTHFRLIIQNINVYVSKMFSRFATQILGLTTRLIYILNKLKYRFSSSLSSNSQIVESSHSMSSNIQEQANYAMMQKEIYRGLRKLNIVAPPPNLSLPNLTKLLVDSLKPNPIFRFQRRINEVVIKPDKNERKIPSKMVFDFLSDSLNLSNSSEIVIDENSPESAMLLLKKAKDLIDNDNNRYNEIYILIKKVRSIAMKNNEHESILLIRNMLSNY